MAEPPDYEDLARRYIALWQDQIVATAADPVLADTLARLFTAFGGMAAWGVAVAAALKRGSGEQRGRRATTSEPEAERAAAAASASDERGDAVDRLARRIAALEERLAVLETGTRRGGERSRPAPRRRRG